jgi:hypothetical protein
MIGTTTEVAAGAATMTTTIDPDADVPATGL